MFSLNQSKAALIALTCAAANSSASAYDPRGGDYAVRVPWILRLRRCYESHEHRCLATRFAQFSELCRSGTSEQRMRFAESGRLKPELQLRPLDHHIHVVADRIMVRPVHAGDFQAGGFNQQAERRRREVVDVVRPTKAAPAIAADVAGKGIEVRNLDDQFAADVQCLAAAARGAGG